VELKAAIVGRAQQIGGEPAIERPQPYSQPRHDVVNGQVGGGRHFPTPLSLQIPPERAKASRLVAAVNSRRRFIQSTPPR
jgi:hypothetical protein